MTFIEPALAMLFESKRLKKGSWAVDRKEDGHRLLFNTQTGEFWSRNCKPVDMRSMPHLVKAVSRMPFGIFDSERERVTGGSSYAVSRIDKPEEFRIVLFDMLAEGSEDICNRPFFERRKRLEMAFDSWCNVGAAMGADTASIGITPLLVEETNSEETIRQAFKAVTGTGGEGVIVKERSSPYRPGKRMNTWLKIKKEQVAAGVLVGFEAGLLGPHSVALIKPDEGAENVRVKSKGNEWLERMDREGDQLLGRRVIFEYTDRTQYGAYKEPRWDRFEDE